MVDRLAALFVAIEYSAKSCLAAQILRQPLCGKHQMADGGTVFFGHVVQGGDVFFRNNQKVHRRLRVDVMKGEAVFVFVYLLGRNLAVDDLAEQAVHAELLIMQPDAGNLRARWSQCNGSGLE